MEHSGGGGAGGRFRLGGVRSSPQSRRADDQRDRPRAETTGGEPVAGAHAAKERAGGELGALRPGTQRDDGAELAVAEGDSDLGAGTGLVGLGAVDVDDDAL